MSSDFSPIPGVLATLDLPGRAMNVLNDITSAALEGMVHRVETDPAVKGLVLTSGKRGLIENAPVIFVGKGAVIPPRAELAGRVALLLDGGIDNSDRQNALLKGGELGSTIASPEVRK